MGKGTFTIIILACALPASVTAEVKHVDGRTLAPKNVTAPKSRRTPVRSSYQRPTAGPFRTKTPSRLNGVTNLSNFSMSPMRPGSPKIFRQARTPASAAGSAGGSGQWGGIDPSLFLNRSFVPPAITSNAGSNQAPIDFTQAIAALMANERGNDLASSLLNQAFAESDNPLSPDSNSAGSGGPGSGGGGGGPSGGPGSKDHNQKLQDELDALKRRQALDDLLRQQERDELERQLADLRNARENGGNGGNGGGAPDPEADVFNNEGRPELDWSGVKPGEFDIGQVPDGTSSGDARDLIAANTNDNPGFQYQTDLGNRRFGCQGSLVYADKGYCVMATAAHCLEESIHGAGASFDSQLGGYSAQVTFRTADFGVIKAVAHMNMEYTNLSQDTGAVVFQCAEDTASKIKVLPISTSVSPGEPIMYGKVMAGKHGYYSGTTFSRSNVSVNGISLADKEIGVRQNGHKIQQGDSGGPLVNSRGELVGVLSTTDGTYSHYASLTSMQFLQRLVDKVQNSAEKEFAEKQREEQQREDEEKRRVAEQEQAEDDEATHEPGA